jgi:hypothetical protein
VSGASERTGRVVEVSERGCKETFVRVGGTYRVNCQGGRDETRFVRMEVGWAQQEHHSQGDMGSGCSLVTHIRGSGCSGRKI